MAKKLIVKVATDLEVSIHAKGFSGPECERATAPYEDALGNVTDRRRTPEYLHQEEAKQEGEAEHHA